jgi:hypothetical protein
MAMRFFFDIWLTFWFYERLVYNDRLRTAITGTAPPDALPV